MNKVSIGDVEVISKAAYEFLIRSDLAMLPDGRYDLGKDVFVNVETYNTQLGSQREFEAHRKYVDLHFMISGREKISVCPIAEMRVKKTYSSQHDIAFYWPDEQAGRKSRDYLLQGGEGIVIYPEEGHMPCLDPPDSAGCRVKKAVVKIPYSFFKDIKYLVMDVDGTLTDGKIYMGNDGEVCKAFNIKDGCGIHDILIPAGIEPVVITARFSDILKIRCKELGIRSLYQAVDNKKEQLYRIIRESSCGLQNVAYIGDDINDMECMRLIKESGGLVGCPAGSAASVKEIADFICTKQGGDGAVREFIEWIV